MQGRDKMAIELSLSCSSLYHLLFRSLQPFFQLQNFLQKFLIFFFKQCVLLFRLLELSPHLRNLLIFLQACFSHLNPLSVGRLELSLHLSAGVELRLETDAELRFSQRSWIQGSISCSIILPSKPSWKFGLVSYKIYFINLGFKLIAIYKLKIYISRIFILF